MEEVDVAIVGAGVSGLAAAVALHKVNPRLSIKVLESRPAPSTKYAGFVKLQPNGLKAAAAISPALASALQKAGLPEKRTLLHGEDGRLVTRLDTREELDAAPASAADFDAYEELEYQGANKLRGSKSGSGSAKAATPSKKGSAKDKDVSDADMTDSKRRSLNVDESSSNIIIGWYELERLLLNMLPAHTVEYEASFMKYHETEGGVVALFEGMAYPLRSRILLGCDGPFSGVRAQCVQDSEPAYDRTVKWVGRLDGHHVSTTPLDFSAWWLKKGQVFVSHPLANGDVGWEALVSDRELQAAGFEFDESAGRVLPVDSEQELKAKGNLAELPPSQALSTIFKSWPKAVVQMVNYTPQEAVLEGGVYIRSASDMPASMGKGRVAILGEAAHPLRPTGQDSNMAFEDAAELAAYVQEYGVSKEALRRYDVARRPRWRHVMQLTAAQGASTTTGIAITHGFLNYTQDLYQRDFKPLGKASQRAAAKLGSKRHGFLGMLVGLTRRIASAGFVTAVILMASGVALPAATHEAAIDAPDMDTMREPRRTAKRSVKLMKRGARRLAALAYEASEHIAEVPGAMQAASLAKTELSAAQEFIEDKAEDATNAAIDVGTGVAKRTVKHRLAKAFGAF